MSYVASTQLVPDRVSRPGAPRAGGRRLGLCLAALGMLVVLRADTAPAACPTAPITLTASQTSCSSACDVNLSWPTPPGAMAGYTLYKVYFREWSGDRWCGSPLSESWYGETISNSFLATGIYPGSVFELRVEVDGCPSSTSSWVGRDSLAVPAGVPTLGGALSGTNAATLTFTPPDSASPRHQLQRSVASSAWTTIRDYPAPGYCPPGGPRTYIDSGLSPGTYLYRVHTDRSYAGGGGPSNVVTVTVPSAPQILTFTASPSTVASGQPATLSWTSAGGETATIDQGVGAVPTSGSVVVAPQQTTTYTLTVTTPGLASATRSVTVTVLQPPVITSFTASPGVLPRGQPATLAWASTGGDSATIDGGVGAVPTSGIAIVAPQQTTMYTLTVTGPGGSATRSVSVSVMAPPVISSFTASPATVQRGQPSTLSWTSTGGEAASIDPGVGFVPTNGSVVVTPLQTTTYTLAVMGPMDRVTRQVTVTVVEPPVITEFLAEPEVVAAGDSVLLRWASTGGTAASLDGGIGPVPTVGSLRVFPLSTRRYVLTVTGPGGSTTAEAGVTVVRLEVSFESEEIALERGSTGSLVLQLNLERTARTVVELSSSDPGVVTVPATVVVPAGQREAPVPVSGLALGRSTVTATLPAALGGGRGTATVEVTCPGPAQVVPRGPATPLPPGAPFNVVWTVPGGGEPATSFVVEVAADREFTAAVARQETSEQAVTLVVPAAARDAVYVRVRAVAACGGLGPWTSALRVAVGRLGPLVVVSEGQSAGWAVRKGASIPPATLRFRNIGSASTRATFVSTGGFFTALRAAADLAPGQEVVVDLAAGPGAGNALGLRQGAVTAAWPEGTVGAPVSLTVAEVVADVVPAVEPETVLNLAAGGGVFTQELRVTNPGSVPIALAPAVRAGGTWLSVEPSDVAEALLPGATRTVRLRIDRAQQTAGDGPPPLFALLELRAVGASSGSLVRVFDAEPGRPVEVASRVPADPGLPSFVLPAAVHAAGAGGAAFTTDLSLRNLSTRPITVDLLAAPRGGGPSLRVEVTVPPLAFVRLFDLVQVAFGRTDLAATIEIRPRNLEDGAQLVVRATTEGQAAASSTRYASEVPVYASGAGAEAGGPPLVMTGVEVTEQVRTNVILAETAGKPVRVALELVGPDGATLGRTAGPLEVPAFGMVQGSVDGLVGLAPGTRVAAASLWIQVVSGDGRAVAFGTAIDNVSQSFRSLTVQLAAASGAAASRVRATDSPAIKPVVIPSVVHAAGIGAFFTSLLSITNETAAPATLRLVYDYEGRDGAGAQVSGTATADRTLPARGSLEVSQGKDLVVNLLGLPSAWQVSGPLRIEGPGVGQVIVRSWVQTPSDLARPEENIKYAEFRGFSATSAEVVGVGSGSLAVLSPAVARLAGQRTNVILTEVLGLGASVKLKLVDGVTGGTIGETPVLELGPYRKLQINEAELWQQLGLGNAERAGLQLVVEALSGEGRVAAVLTTIDNRTNATLVAPFAAAGPQSPGIGVGR